MTELDTGELIERAQRAAGERWPRARLHELKPLPGGISSLTFSAQLDAGGEGAARKVVVKVAPPGLPPVRNRDVLRQARVIRAVHAAPGVSVPEVLLQDDGSPPFFVMEFVAGQAYEPKWDVTEIPPGPELVDRRARAAAAMLARLQGVEPAAVGLETEALTLDQELNRWSQLFATAGDELRGNERVLAQALAQRIPRPVPPRILHGDYRMGNMQFDGGRLAAIIDWEIWSVGDPRIDLAWLMMFADPVQQRVSDRDAANQDAADAMPHPNALLHEYLTTAERGEPADMPWFHAFVCYKLGAAMAVLAKRNRRLPDPDPGLELAAVTLAPSLAHGLELLTA